MKNNESIEQALERYDIEELRTIAAEFGEIHESIKCIQVNLKTVISDMAKLSQFKFTSNTPLSDVDEHININKEILATEKNLLDNIDHTLNQIHQIRESTPDLYEADQDAEHNLSSMRSFLESKRDRIQQLMTNSMAMDIVLATLYETLNQRDNASA